MQSEKLANRGNLPIAASVRVPLRFVDSWGTGIRIGVDPPQAAHLVYFSTSLTGLSRGAENRQ